MLLRKGNSPACGRLATATAFGASPIALSSCCNGLLPVLAVVPDCGVRLLLRKDVCAEQMYSVQKHTGIVNVTYKASAGNHKAAERISWLQVHYCV
jgi:hypothetical protein